MRGRVMAAVTFLLFVAAASASAEWIYNGSALCRAPGDQQAAVSVSDGQGGAIVVWRDFRNGSHWDIFAQRVDALGATHWAYNGVPVCQATNLQDSLAAVADGLGGVVVAWHDFRNGNYDIYAQRLNSSGAPQWALDGIPVCTAAGDQTSPSLVADGAGGFLVAWQDTRSGNSDIYVARVTVAGTLAWTTNGVAVCLSGGEQLTARVAADGTGGAIVAWEDYRAGLDIYARRVSAAGVPLWAANGVAVCATGSDQRRPRILSDGVGGAMIFWEDHRSSYWDIYGDRFDASGLSQWAANGVVICDAQYDQTHPVVVSDSAGGAIIAWEDNRYSGSYPDIFTQRVDNVGVPQWTTQGVLLSSQGYPYDMWPAIVSDGAGGAYVAWEYNSTGDADIQASHVDGTGRVGWVGGSMYVTVCSASYSQRSPTIVLDGTGGAIVAWDDGRSNVTRDIFAQRVEPRHGYWGRPEPTIDLVSDVRGDQGGQVALDWRASQRDIEDHSIAHYSIWRATRPVDGSTATQARFASRLVQPQDVGAHFRGPATWIQHTASGDYFWEWVADQNAMYFPGYSYTVPTRNDSTAADHAVHYFLVIAHTSDASIFWPSDPMSGYSVDNLAPAAPLALEAARTGQQEVQLAWARSHESDLRDYAVYRSTEPGVVPSLEFFLAASADTSYVDTAAQTGTPYYYIVTASDVHGNQGPPSAEVSVAGSTAAQDMLRSSGLALLSNAPNPFRTTTTLRFGLARSSDVQIALYDVQGRAVWTQVLPAQAAGWHSVSFAGTDDRGRPLPSGVYMYRVRAAGLERSQRMIVAR
ncbi:MAG: FlgD immunoglobulin-like domain containing protein [bacterium]